MDKRLIIKFLERKCTAEEEKAVVEWMHSRDFEPELLSHIEDDLIQMEPSAGNEGELQTMLQNQTTMLNELETLLQFPVCHYPDFVSSGSARLSSSASSASSSLFSSMLLMLLRRE